jgi:hypothetical protein
MEELLDAVRRVVGHAAIDPSVGWVVPHEDMAALVAALPESNLIEGAAVESRTTTPHHEFRD